MSCGIFSLQPGCVPSIHKNEAHTLKPDNTKKIKKEDLRETPEWLKRSTEAAKRSPLAKMSEEEIGQLCEELAEKGARARQAREIRKTED